MSVHVVAWTLKHSEARLGERLVLLVLADHAKDDGTCSWPGQETIAHEARLSARQVRRCLTNLEESGEIRRQGTSRSGTVIWAVNMTPDIMSARTSTTEERSDMSDEPSLNHPVERERARARVKIGGKPVNETAWQLTADVLAEFNSQAGRKLRLLTSAGQPSDAAKRIYGRVRDYPDLTLGELTDIIRRTLASQWWGDDTPSVGVVFGPKVFEENITRPGIRRPSRHEPVAESVAEGDALIAAALGGRR